MNLTGQLLISMPTQEDERFEKSVIYMCAHSKDGAMGIIINKKIDYDLYPDLLEQTIQREMLQHAARRAHRLVGADA